MFFDKFESLSEEFRFLRDSNLFDVLVAIIYNKLINYNQRVMEPQYQQDVISSDQQTEATKIYTNPEEYLEWCKADKKIKIMDEMNPILNNIYLKDISLHKKGPMEDKIYSKRPLYYWNIRRGNTLCEIYDNQKRVDLFFCRRGMIKFFDLQPKFLQGNKSNLIYRQALVRRVIFNQLDEKLSQGGYKFHLYSLFKQNGQHCQISYIKKLNAWLFASKNVSIIVRNQQDIEIYKKQRFYWAKLIATQFLATINNMPEQTRESFKSDIVNKTLIGEYCGYQKHQHITKYDKIQIIFYAIVENVSDQSCLPVDEAFKLFDKYDLKKVYTQSYKDLTNQTEVYQKIYELMKKIATGSMEVVGQGSVLYIVAEKDGVQKTISLSKLKSAEYLIFRKLRQMLKINLNKKGQTANTLNKFKFQIDHLVKQLFNPPYPLQYYFKIAEMAFKEVGDKFQDMDESQLRYRFVNFLQNVLSKSQELNKEIKQIPKQNTKFNRIVVVSLPKTLDQTFNKRYRQRGIKIEEVFRQGVECQKQTVFIIHMAPRVTQPQKNQKTLFLVCHYTDTQVKNIISGLEKQQEPYNQSIINFIRAPDKEKQVQLLNNKIQAFSKLCQQNKSNYILVKGQNKQQQIQSIINSQFCGEQKKEKTPTRYIIIPLLIPGSGKTLLTKQLKDIGFNIEIMESDQIRRKIYKRLQEENDNKLTNTQLFNISKAQALSDYKHQVNKLVQKQVKQNEFLFIDRIVAPTYLQQLEIFQKPNHCFIFVTQGGVGWRNSDADYPFSVTYLLNCFKRCIEREGHEILQNDPIGTMKVVLKFYNMFKGWKLSSLEKRYPGSKIIKLPFVQDRPEDDEQISNPLKSKIRQCLKHIVPGHDPSDSNSFSELVELYYSSKFPVRNPNPRILAQNLIANFKGLI